MADDHSKAGATADNRRRRHRYPVLWKAKLYQRGELFDCVVRNFSATGAGLVLEVQAATIGQHIDRGEIVTLTLNRFGDFPGQVAWCREDRIGVAFMRHPDEVEALIDAFLLHKGDRPAGAPTDTD